MNTTTTKQHTTTSAAGHTPGPWQFSPGHSPHFQSEIYEETGRTVAATYNDKQSANARLIAAAPELLEALQQIYSATLGNGPAHIERERAFSIARAAIAHATSDTTF